MTNTQVQLNCLSAQPKLNQLIRELGSLKIELPIFYLELPSRLVSISTIVKLLPRERNKIKLKFQLGILGQSLRQVRPSSGASPFRNLPFRVRHLELPGPELHLDAPAQISRRLQHRLCATICHALRRIFAHEAESEMCRSISKKACSTSHNLR